jgi:hypothetical protein
MERQPENHLHVAQASDNLQVIIDKLVAKIKPRIETECDADEYMDEMASISSSETLVCSDSQEDCEDAKLLLDLTAQNVIHEPVVGGRLNSKSKTAKKLECDLKTGKPIYMTAQLQNYTEVRIKVALMQDVVVPEHEKTLQKALYPNWESSKHRRGFFVRFNCLDS